MIEAVFNEELDSFLGRLRYGRDKGAVKGYLSHPVMSRAIPACATNY